MRSGAVRLPGTQPVPGDVEALPHVQRDRVPDAAGVLPGGGQRAGHRGRALAVEHQRAHQLPGVGLAAGADGLVVGQPHRVQQRADHLVVGLPATRRAAGAGRCRGSGRCSRRARRAGRASTATRRSGSARSTPSPSRPAVADPAAVADRCCERMDRGVLLGSVGGGSGKPIVWLIPPVVWPMPTGAMTCVASTDSARSGYVESAVGRWSIRVIARDPPSTQVSLRAAALRGVHHQLALGQRDPGQAAGQHPDRVAVVHRERPQVDVPWPHLVADQRRHRRQRDLPLRDPAARVRRGSSRGPWPGWSSRPATR